MPADVNPAEYMLEAIGAGSRKRVGGDWYEKWKNSPELVQVKQEIEQLKANAISQPGEETANRGEYATSFLFQFRTVLHRSTCHHC